MMQFSFYALLVLVFLGFASSKANESAVCRSVSPSEISEQVHKHGSDPASVVKKVSSVLHSQFKNQQGDAPNKMLSHDSDIRIQMSVVYNYFALFDWTKKLENIKTIKSLEPNLGTELDYAFTHWLRTKYLSAVRELARERELFQVFREPGYTQEQKQTVVANPASLVVTDYKPFTCTSDWDQSAYDCSKKHVIVTTQLSPDVLCSNQSLAKQSRFRFLIDVSRAKFKVVDVEYGGHRLYQDAYIDLKQLLTIMKPEAVIKRIKLWSHTDTNPTPEATLMAFRQYLDQSTAATKTRMPASQSK